jgi:hypothetical protein
VADRDAEPTLPAPGAPIVLFGEELVSEPPLPVLLAEVQERLAAFRDRYGDVLPADERFELLSSALDELDVALESVRAARERLGRIETRLALAFDSALARLRMTERELLEEA